MCEHGTHKIMLRGHCHIEIDSMTFYGDEISAICSKIFHGELSNSKNRVSIRH